MKSITTLAQNRSLKVTTKIVVIFSVVLFFSFGVFLTNEISSSLDRVFHSIAPNLSQSVQIGDGFQLRRLLGALTESDAANGASFIDSSGDVISTSGKVSPKEKSFSIEGFGVLLSRKYNIVAAGQQSIGTLFLQKNISLVPFLYLLALTCFLSAILFPIIRGELFLFSKKLIQPIEELPSKLFGENTSDNSKKSEIIELKQIYDRLGELKSKESDLKLAHDDIKNKERLLWLSSQVAHDIRSPLSTLQVLFKEFGIAGQRKEKLIQHAIRRIDEISQDLLAGDFIRNIGSNSAKSFSLIPDMTERATIAQITSAISLLVEEKRATLPKGKEVRFHFSQSKNTCEIGINGNLSQLQRILSNLFTNSIEAIDSSGDIRIGIDSNDDSMMISIGDTGRGIAEDRLQCLGTTPVSFKGASGHGLGIFHAFKTIESYGGKIEIQSELGVGTKVLITIPSFVCNQKADLPIDQIVLIDDDAMVRETWEISAISHGKHFIGFPDVESFQKEAGKFSKEGTAIYVDEHLGAGVRGSILIPDLKGLGFEHVFLATGGQGNHSNGKLPPWLAISNSTEVRKFHNEDFHQGAVS